MTPVPPATKEERPAAGTRPAKDASWYKSGVIYELHVRAFADSDGDGMGDFPGLTAKLDYLRDLGVTALWLLPFYPSPLKDDGYDIADYYEVHPRYGRLEDFKAFLEAAHQRGLRVITELVLNHTSDQHPWFQKSRRAAPGSVWRDYYVWNDTPDKYTGARIIFKDTELSNWSWDPVAKAYYWHRFYSHQPDLNFECPAVHEELLKVLDFWLDLGVDGIRLDAVPYLYEREGTSCENLPETHAFLKRMRRHVDEKYGDRLLLGEANQWPEDAVAYFGSGRGDECHMAFHFPLMPRLFMALRMEDRVPLVDILQQTPAIPETSQWALFLRNHDELTLEMVTDEERDYMYRMYARPQFARLNLGIRRRLAPLVGNDRRRIELLSALLFSLPGTPVIYYGDEIGMGENLYLGDRNGVRTPMQWSADKNAGFSRANPQSLYLPINLDPENHYEAVNVEVQERNPHSLLWWMKRLIALHKKWRAFGLGSLEFLQPENRKVFACLRQHGEECILVVANLSRFVQPVSLDLAAFASRTPMELFGRTEFPAITDQPYFLTLGPHAFYWFSLEKKSETQGGSAASPGEVPSLNVVRDWRELLAPGGRAGLELVLLAWLPTRRWFAGKNQIIKALRILDVLRLPAQGDEAAIVLLEVDFLHHEPESYTLPLACVHGEPGRQVAVQRPEAVVARLVFENADESGVLLDGLVDVPAARATFESVLCQQKLAGDAGFAEAHHLVSWPQTQIEAASGLEPIPSKFDPSGSSLIFGDAFTFKFLRQQDSGTSQELEIGRFLTEKKFPHTPPLLAAMEYVGRAGERATLAVVHAFTPGSQSAWDYTLEALARYYERVQALPPEERQAPRLPNAESAPAAALDPRATLEQLIGPYLANVELLGERTAALHLALSSETDDPSFQPEPLTPHAQRGLYQSMRNITREAMQLLARQRHALPVDCQTSAEAVLAAEAEILGRFKALYDHPLDLARIRCHGNFHLEHVLFNGKDFLIADFEGEPALALSERRLKRCALQDVAGMLRSFHYASRTALRKFQEHSTALPVTDERINVWERAWVHAVAHAFFTAYLRVAGKAVFIPSAAADLQMLTHAYVLRKALVELNFELNHRPEWVAFALESVLAILKTTQLPEIKKVAPAATR